MIWHAQQTFVNPTNTSRVFHVETTWNRPFPRRLNVEYTWCVCKEVLYHVVAWIKLYILTDSLCYVVTFFISRVNGVSHSFIFPLLILFRSSHRRCSIKKVFFKISQNSQENICAKVSFILKRRLWHRCFPVNFAKVLRTPFLQNTSGQLLLFIQMCKDLLSFRWFSVVLSQK